MLIFHSQHPGKIDVSTFQSIRRISGRWFFLLSSAFLTSGAVSRSAAAADAAAADFGEIEGLKGICDCHNMGE